MKKIQIDFQHKKKCPTKNQLSYFNDNCTPTRTQATVIHFIGMCVKPTMALVPHNLFFGNFSKNGCIILLTNPNEV
jgi:hypothetical protein